MMIPTWRLDEIERRGNDDRRRVGALESRMTAAEQLASKAGSSPGVGGGPAGGSYYADPGSTVIDALDFGELEVMEILGGGDVSLGTKLILNKHSESTLPSLRLFLSPCRDGSFSVDNQDCPTPGGGG